MKNEIPGLIAPTQAPQLEAESLLEIRDLMMAAPAWDPMLAPELLHLCRNFVAVRSAIGFALELAQAIFNSENPQQAHAALNHLVNGLANKMMEDTGKRMLAVAQQMFAAMPKITTAQITTTSRTDKFNTKFPELNRPAFQPAVAQIAQAMQADYQRKGQPIDEKFIDALGNAVHTFLEQEMGVSFRPNKSIAPAPTPGNKQVQQPQQTPPKGKFFTPGNARQESALPNGKANDWRDLVI